MSTQKDNYIMDRRRLQRDETAIYDIDLKEILRAFLRHKYAMAATLVGFILLGMFWGISQPKLYSTQTIVQINSRNAQVLNKIEAVVSNVEQENVVVQTDVDLIRSPYLATRVVDALNLTQYPEFNKTLQKPSTIAKIKAWFKEPILRDAEGQAAYAKNVTIRTLLDKIRVSSTPRSLTINIRAEAEQPELAVKIANRIAYEYLSDQREYRADTTEEAGEFLDGRLDELRDKLAISEKKVQQFQRKHGLFETQGRTVTDQQMSELNTQLILARADRAEKEALLRQVNQVKRSGGTGSVSSVLNSTVIQSLKVQESELARQQADIASRYGPKHPRMANIKAEVADLSAKINQEVTRIVGGIENDVAIARSRENELNRSLNRIKSQVGVSKSFALELAELEREMNSDRAVYEAFLSRSKETAQQKNLVQNDARIISRAVKPIKPASPRLKIIFILSTFLGLCGAVALVALLEHTDDTFRTLTQIEKATRYVGLGMLPLLDKGADPILYLRNKPTSLFAENLRKIQSAAHFSNAENSPKVMMVTSTLMGEGKSTVSISISHVAAQAGLKVLLIDADMRRPTMAEYIKLEFKHSLADVLAGKVAFEKAIYHENVSGMDLMFSRPNTNNSNELLNGERMDALLKRARKTYDLIIIDTPPVSALVDTTTLARKVDTTVFVLRWGDTAKGMVDDAVAHMKNQNFPVAGVVLNQVDMDQAPTYGFAGEYKRYSAYYHD